MHWVSRATLVARDSSLSPGAIAGAVVGSVIGAALVILCILPFVLRARNLRRYPDGDPLQAEIGQSPGGLVFPQGQQLNASHRRLSSSDVEPGSSPTSDQAPVNGHEKSNGFSQHGPTLPAGVAFQQGLPSPISPPLSPTAASQLGGVGAGERRQQQQQQQQAPTEPSSPGGLASETPQWSPARGGSTGTVGWTASRDMSGTDSFSPLSQQSTGFVSDRITEEPAHIGQDQPHRHWSLRRLMHGGSRRSTTHSEAPRSPSIGPGEFLSHAETAPPTFPPIDTEAPGEAYSYYHGDIDAGPPYTPSSYTFAPPPITTSASAFASASGQQHTQSPSVHGPAPTFGSGPTQLVEEPEAVSPDSDKTVSPVFGANLFSRLGSLAKRSPGQSIQRMDTLPPQDIVADIPSPPVQPSNEPSGNPMDIMKPSNEVEENWMRDQEMIRIENSPPPLGQQAQVPPTPESVEHDAHEYAYVQTDFSSEQEHHHGFAVAPPEIELNGKDLDMVDMTDMNDMSDMIDISDYSTPPHSVLPSAENTPDTRVTESSFPGSPSTPPLSVADHRTPGPSPQAGQSPGSFVCDTCGRAFDQIHKLK